MPVIVRLVLLAAFVLAAGSVRAEACSCTAVPQACERAFQVDAVFSGTVRGIEPVDVDERGLPRANRVTFDVHERFRGIDGPTAVIVTSTESAACGYHFAAGAQYLVYATRSGGELRTGICDRTQPLVNAAADLEFLRTLSQPVSGGAHVFGRVRHEAFGVSGSRLGAYRVPDDVRVSLEGPDGTREVQPTADGRYELTQLPPGTYEMSLLPPAGMVARFLQSSRVSLPDPRACAARDVTLAWDGRIVGRLVAASGVIQAGTRVVLAEAVTRTPDGTYVGARQSVVGSDGTFEIREVPPGRYVLGVLRAPAMSFPPLRPSWFHPGTPDWQDAWVIDLGRGERRILPPLRLPDEPGQ